MALAVPTRLGLSVPESLFTLLHSLVKNELQVFHVGRRAAGGQGRCDEARESCLSQETQYGVAAEGTGYRGRRWGAGLSFTMCYLGLIEWGCYEFKKITSNTLPTTWHVISTI